MAITTVTTRDCTDPGQSSRVLWEDNCITLPLRTDLRPVLARQLRFRGQCRKMREDLPGGILLGIFFGGALGTADEFRCTGNVQRPQPRFHGKNLAMFRALLLDQYVSGLGTSGSL